MRIPFQKGFLFAAMMCAWGYAAQDDASNPGGASPQRQSQALRVSGRATFSDGNAVGAQPIQLQLVFVLEPDAVAGCAAAEAKKQANALTSAESGPSGNYSALYSGADIVLLTQSDCTLDAFIMGAMSSVRILASIEANSSNCQRFCGPAAASATCMNSCLESGRILGDRRLTKAELVTSGQVGAGGEFTIPADLVFDALPPARSGTALPDLTVAPEAVKQSVEIVSREFEQGSCAISEGCIGAPGVRRLLLFDTEIFNSGGADFEIGIPNGDNPLFEYASCHGHYHLGEMVRYELVSAAPGDTAGSEVLARASKQGFCMMDAVQLVGSKAGRFHCDFQGISAGWSDVYDRTLDCQWVDITGLPPGDYFLRLIINPELQFLESDYSNNAVSVPVTIPAGG